MDADERRDLLFRLAVVAAAVLIQLVAFDKGLQIELRARWLRLRQLLDDRADDERTRVAEWVVAQELPAVIARAEEITRDATYPEGPEDQA